ncbi:bifunctional oligoribonuclease/PAP phosphatase NrnA [Mycoplasmatota bacterium WC44]
MKEKIITKIREFDDIIIVPHIRPDGDCIGSSFGLKYTIESLFPHKNVYVVGNHSRDTDFMGEISQLDDQLFKKSLIISLDTGSLSRVIDNRVTTGKYLIRIDHHPHVENFGDLEYVDSSFPSTCTIITNLFRENNIKIPKRAAECLFFGTITDTGRFKHRGVNTNTHINAAYLLETGIDTSKIFNYVYLKELSTLELDGYVLNNLKFTGNGVIYITLTTEVLDKLRIDKEQAGNTVSRLENIIGYPVWAVFYELEDKVRVRLRSRGPIVNDIASNFRGGGHQLASGATLNSWDELDNILKQLDDRVIEYKKG